MVREELRLMSEQDLVREAELEDLRHALAQRVEQLDRGEGRPIDVRANGVGSLACTYICKLKN